MENRNRVRVRQMQKSKQLKDAAKAREERAAKKDEAQVEFFKSGKQRNEAFTKQSAVFIRKTEQELEESVSDKKGKLVDLVVKCWKPDDTTFDGVSMDRLEFVESIWDDNMKPGHPMYKKLLMLLSLLQNRANNW